MLHRSVPLSTPRSMTALDIHIQSQPTGLTDVIQAEYRKDPWETKETEVSHSRHTVVGFSPGREYDSFASIYQGLPTFQSISAAHPQKKASSAYDDFLAARNAMSDRLAEVCGYDVSKRAHVLMKCFESLHPHYANEACETEWPFYQRHVRKSYDVLEGHMRTYDLTTAYQERVLGEILKDVPLPLPVPSPMTSQHPIGFDYQHSSQIGQVSSSAFSVSHSAPSSSESNPAAPSSASHSDQREAILNAQNLTFFDVGVGRGDWSRYVLETFPSAKGGGLTLWLGSMSQLRHGAAVSPSVFKPYAVLTYAARTNYRYLINYGDVTHPGCMRLHRPELLPAHLRKQVIDECYASPANLVLCDALLAKTEVSSALNVDGDAYGGAREPYAHKHALMNEFRSVPILEVANSTMLLANVRVMLRRIASGGNVVLHFFHGLTPWTLDILVFLVSLFEESFVYAPVRSSLESAIRQSIVKRSMHVPTASTEDDGRYAFMDMEEDFYILCKKCKLPQDKILSLADDLFRINLRGHDTCFAQFLSKEAREETTHVRHSIKKFVEGATMDRVKFMNILAASIPVWAVSQHASSSGSPSFRNAYLGVQHSHPPAFMHRTTPPLARIPLSEIPNFPSHPLQPALENLRLDMGRSADQVDDFEDELPSRDLRFAESIVSKIVPGLGAEASPSPLQRSSSKFFLLNPNAPPRSQEPGHL
eukprot:ANDGO_03537.mRNA.1 hypothetical protein